MQIELTKEIAMDLVKGSEPPLPLLEEFDYFGSYSDQYGRYYWKTDVLNRMSVEGLFHLYKRTKETEGVV